MSKVESVKVEQKFRTGEYEHIMVTVAAAPDDGENPAKVVIDLIKLTEARDGAAAVTTRDTAVTGSGEKPGKKPADKPAEQTRVDKKEDAKTDKAPKEEPKSDKAEPRAKKPGKPTPYDKEIDLHKKKVSEFMDAAFPEKLANGKLAWKNDPLIVHARECATEMVGKPCLDGEGNVVDAFKDEFINLYKEKITVADAGL